VNPASSSRDGDVRIAHVLFYRDALFQGEQGWKEIDGGNRPGPVGILPTQVSCPLADRAAMSHDTSVARRHVKITNEYGLHLGPAAKFVKLATKFQADIRVLHNGKEINGKSILDLTLLAAESGTKLDLEARGVDAEEALDALSRLVLSEFREGEDLPNREASA
jgi:phosphocarrier protein HPr